MKKVVALFLSAIMLLSAVAFAESKSPVPGITVISVDPAESQVIIDNNSEIAKALVTRLFREEKVTDDHRKTIKKMEKAEKK